MPIKSCKPKEMHEEDFISASGDTPVFTDVSSTKKQVTTKIARKHVKGGA